MIMIEILLNIVLHNKFNKNKFDKNLRIQKYIK